METLLQGGSDIEIVIVDDGSTDSTAAIARDYCEKYPDIVRLEQKENGGHGSAVNRGLLVARGIYFKVCDSDDWFDVDAFRKVLALLREHADEENRLDLLLANYVYEYFYNGKRHEVDYRNALPVGELFDWSRMQRFRISQFLLMHSMIYRTELLRECGLKLPEHTFYVDNIVAYVPLPYVKRVMYLDCDLYRYFIGRPDQSVSTENMIKRIDQQLRVTRIMVQAYNLYEDIADRHLRRYMLHYLSMMVTISIIHLTLSGTRENIDKIDALWAFIRNYDRKTYYALRRTFLNRSISLPGKGGRFIARKGYTLARRIYKFS